MKDYVMRTIGDDELKKEEIDKQERFDYPDGTNQAWIEAGVNGFGLFKIHVKEGALPKEFRQMFTSYQRAKETLDRYFEKLNGAKDGANQRSVFEGVDNRV